MNNKSLIEIKGILVVRRDKMEEKKCNCSKDCTCGCQEGKECTCKDKDCKCGCHEDKECNCKEDK